MAPHCLTDPENGSALAPPTSPLGSPEGSGRASKPQGTAQGRPGPREGLSISQPSTNRHLDWDVHSCVLRSNCLGHELRFWDAPSGQQIAHASACRDLEWASFGVTLGWHCQGIFLGRADGTGINGVDRSPDGALLATVDATGGVNLHRYPCVQPEKGKPNWSSFYGHASSALACGWAGDQLLSIGGLDLCLFQWERVKRSA